MTLQDRKLNRALKTALKSSLNKKMQGKNSCEAAQRLRFFYIGPWFISYSYYRYGEKGRRGQRRWRRCGERRRWRRRSRSYLGGTHLFPRGCLRFGEENRGAHGAATLPRMRSGIKSAPACRRRRRRTEEALSSWSKLVIPPLLSSYPLFCPLFCSAFVVRLVSSRKQN